MKKGIILLVTTTILTGIFWFLTQPSSEATFLYLFSQFIAVLALMGFTFIFFISTRHHLVDKLFNGLDKAYIVHKWLAISSIILVILHIAILVFIRSTGLIDPSIIQFGRSGMISFLLFVILALIALLAKKAKYEIWKNIHKLMILPYIIGLFHYYVSSTYDPFGFNLFSIWINILNIIGIISAFYIIFLYEKTAFPYKYKVSSVKTVAKETVEITGKALRKHISYKPGQFTFLKISKGTVKFPSHPFTISNSPQDNIIQFTVKNLGDHTAKLVDTIKIDDVFSLTNPHGMFDYSKGVKNQVWIAGGIGITPFRSFYQATIPKNFSIDFFYSYSNEEGAYLDELENLDKENLRIHLVNSKEEGRLNAEKIEEKVGVETPVEVYFCGPAPMRDSLKKSLKNSGISVVNFHFEEFKFLQ